LENPNNNRLTPRILKISGGGLKPPLPIAGYGSGTVESIGAYN